LVDAGCVCNLNAKRRAPRGGNRQAENGKENLPFCRRCPCIAWTLNAIFFARFVLGGWQGISPPEICIHIFLRNAIATRMGGNARLTRFREPANKARFFVLREKFAMTEACLSWSLPPFSAVNSIHQFWLAVHYLLLNMLVPLSLHLSSSTLLQS